MTIHNNDWSDESNADRKKREMSEFAQLAQITLRAILTLVQVTELMKAIFSMGNFLYELDFLFVIYLFL